MSKPKPTPAKSVKPVAKKAKALPVKTAPKAAAKAPPVKAKAKSKAPAKPAPKAPEKAAKKAVPAKKARVKPVSKTVAKKAPAKPAVKEVKKAPVKPAPAAKAPAKSAPKASAKPAVKSAAKTPTKPAKAPAVVTPAPQKKKPAPAPAPEVKTKAAKAAPKAEVVIEVVEEVAPEPQEVKAPVFRQSLPPLPPGPAANGAIYYDSHMHTPLCKHAWGEPEEYAAQALKAGMKGVIFTCHCPMPDGFWPAVRMADSEFDTYLAMVDRTAKAFKGKLDVRLGLESEFFPGTEGWIEELHQRADFDYILGAVHWQARDYLAKFETGTIEAFRKTYFNQLALSAESGLYDCLAHPDLVKNYHPDSWCLAIVKGGISTALDRIAATGVAMELNTSGLNKSYSEMNPGMEMLRMMAEREIPVVIGSDSHRPHRVGEHFMTALSHLQEAGYDKVSYFLNRKRIDLKISEVQASIKKAADAQMA